MPMNQLHPVYHGHSFQPGSRIDVEQTLPADLEDADLEEFLEQLCEPPRYIERIAPVSTIIGTDVIRGRNWTEMMINSYRTFLRIFTSVAFYIRQALAEKFGERGMLPFTSLDIDPDTLHRIIELDYEHGENTYGQLMEMFRSGVLAPCATTPFDAIVPLLDNDFDRRLVIRSGLLYYWNLLKDYHNYIRQQHGEALFIVLMWLPQCGYSKSTLEILYEEFAAKVAEEEGIPAAHLVVLLDSVQALERDNDVLMKSWNQTRISDKASVSVVFRDRAFSDWVTYSNPSVKKLIDRTIAKVDSELNAEGVDYCWGHFEELEALTFSAKSSLNFEQKIVKLAQLSYMTVSPDIFVRRKLNGRFGRAAHEPQEVSLKQNSAWNDWHTNASFGRWEGVLDSNAKFKLVDENRPFVRRTRAGKVQEIGPQCWKIAYNRAIDNCTKAIKGDPETMKGGFLEVLASICGSKDPEVVKRNVADFLAHYTYIHWREHFLQHNMSEADVALQEVVDEHLMRECKKRLRDEDYAMAGVAAQGYYYALDAHRSHATYWESLDQRAAYQNVMMAVLAMRNLVYLYHWQEKPQLGRKIVDILKQELFEFHTAYERYRLADYGVTLQEWKDSIKSMLDDNPMNIVERCARRLAARHLRPLGYVRDFTREDEYITTNVGHIWTAEVENTNYKWENKFFCGLKEE